MEPMTLRIENSIRRIRRIDSNLSYSERAILVLNIVKEYVPEDVQDEYFRLL